MLLDHRLLVKERKEDQKEIRQGISKRAEKEGNKTGDGSLKKGKEKKNHKEEINGNKK